MKRATDLQDVLVAGLKDRNSENVTKAGKALANWCLEECKLPQAVDGLKALYAAKGEADKITMLPNLVMNGDITSLVNIFNNTHFASSELTKHAALFTLELNRQYLRTFESSLAGMSGIYAPPISQPDMVVKDYIAKIHGEMNHTAADINAAWQSYQLGVLNQTIESSLDEGGGILAPIWEAAVPPLVAAEQDVHPGATTAAPARGPAALADNELARCRPSTE